MVCNRCGEQSVDGVVRHKFKTFEHTEFPICLACHEEIPVKTVDVKICRQCLGKLPTEARATLLSTDRVVSRGVTSDALTLLGVQDVQPSRIPVPRPQRQRDHVRKCSHSDESVVHDNLLTGGYDECCPKCGAVRREVTRRT